MKRKDKLTSAKICSMDECILKEVSPQCGSNINDLPDEIFINIFKDASVHQLRCVLPLVCKRWQKIAQDSFIWKNLIVKIAAFPKNSEGCPTNGESVLKFIRLTPQIQVVRLTGSVDPEYFTKILRNLDMYSDNLHTLSIDLLATCYCNDRKSEHCTLNDSSDCLDAVCWTRLTKVKTLEISIGSSKWLEPCAECFKSYRKIIKYFPNLVALKLSWAPVPNLKTILALANSLEHLEVNILHFSSNTLEELPGNFPKLKLLGVNCNSPASCKNLFSVPANILRTLELDEPFRAPVFSSGAVERFFSSAVFIRLETIKLGTSRIDDLGALAIRRHCPIVRRIDIDLDPTSNLSRTGLCHFLHINSLRNLEVRFVNQEDWNYWRTATSEHCCNENEPCPLGVDSLLAKYWHELELAV